MVVIATNILLMLSQYIYRALSKERHSCNGFSCLFVWPFILCVCVNVFVCLSHPSDVHCVWLSIVVLVGVVCKCVHGCVSGSECSIFSGALFTPTRDTDALSRIRHIISLSLFEVSKNYNPKDVSSSSSICKEKRKQGFPHRLWNSAL